jgi:HTH-type transcriptional regulator/antitoxin HigA
MRAKIIKTKAEYEAALSRIDKLMDAAPDTPEGDELELFSLLVRDYEEEKFPITKPDPIAAIRFRMEQQGLSQKDLVPILGSRSHISEVLSGRRRLSLKMIRALVVALRIPAELLLGETAKG